MSKITARKNIGESKMKLKCFLCNAALFIFGLGVLGFSQWMFLKLNVDFVPRGLFLWVSLYVMYLAFAVPAGFVQLKNVDSGRKPRSLFSHAKIFVLIFEVLCLILMLTVYFKLIPVLVGWIVLGVLILGLLTAFFIAFRKNQRALKAQSSETPALGLITQIRTSLDTLVLKTNALPEKNFTEKKKIEALDESVNNMTSVCTIDAAKLEQEILMNVTQISSLCDSVIAGSDDASFKKVLSVLENQIRERNLKENR